MERSARIHCRACQRPGLQTSFEKIHDYITYLNVSLIHTDSFLMQELIQFEVNSKPLGITLISSKDKCLQCQSKLILRKDRPSLVVVYDDIMGSIPGSH